MIGIGSADCANDGVQAVIDLFSVVGKVGRQAQRVAALATKTAQNDAVFFEQGASKNRSLGTAGFDGDESASVFPACWRTKSQGWMLGNSALDVTSE